MAIIKCKECKTEVSNKAKNCPSCGAPVKSRIGCGGFIVILFCIGVVMYNLPSIMSPVKTTTQNDILLKPREQVRQLLGTLTLDRAWDENIGGYRCSYALVTWENTTTDTFNAGVTIQAVAYDSRGQKINENQRSFFVHERGPIVPGFKGTLKIPVELGEAQFARMECSVISAR